MSSIKCFYQSQVAVISDLTFIHHVPNRIKNSSARCIELQNLNATMMLTITTTTTTTKNSNTIGIFSVQFGKLQIQRYEIGHFVCSSFFCQLQIVPNLKFIMLPSIAERTFLFLSFSLSFVKHAKQFSKFLRPLTDRTALLYTVQFNSATKFNLKMEYTKLPEIEKYEHFLSLLSPPTEYYRLCSANALP